MHVYAAAVYTNSLELGGLRYRRMNENEQKVLAEIPHILESYHYVQKQSYVDKLRKDKRKIFLDSGAFSAWTKCSTINLEAYCNYIKENSDVLLTENGIPVASVLDSIGDAKGTYANQKNMESKGVFPLPCFHYGEDPKYLEYYAQNYPYITLGGMVAVHKKDLTKWLDEIWCKYLISGSGRAKVKVHGFGLTTYDLLLRYPWYSTDSSSWVQAGTNGSVVTTEQKAISLSDKSPSRKMHNQHYTSMPEIYKRKIERYVEQQGFDLERLQSNYESRWAFNLKAFTDLNTLLNTKEIVFKEQQRSLF